MHADASSLTRVRIEAAVKPTENPAKVKAAVLNIFPDASFTESEGLLTAEARSLDRLKEVFATQRIRDAARKVLRSSMSPSALRFSLNKQAAFVGKANFALPSPLGAIVITVEDEDPERIVGFLTGKRREAPERPPGDREP